MAETIINKHSQNEYKRLGDRIRKDPEHIAAEDLEMLQDLRLTYKEPLSTVFNTLEKVAYRVDPNCICTYRVKRIESIISKLIRFPSMQVQRAEDIAGCRCILSSKEMVYEVLDKLQKSNMPFVIKGKINDYIESPKVTGYRSVHLNVVIKDGDNRRIEIQLRTYEMHNWATLVEITDLIFKSKLKEYQGKFYPDLYEFHQLLAKSDNELTMAEKMRICKIVDKYQYITRISSIFAHNYIEVRNQWNELKVKKCKFFLISTDENGVPEFEGFRFFEEAEAAYFELYNNNDGNLNIVLTHLKDTEFSKISVAYSNYFMTFNAILSRVLRLIGLATVLCYKWRYVAYFPKAYDGFLSTIDHWIKIHKEEVNSFLNDRNMKKSMKKRNDWALSMNDNVRVVYDIFQETQSKLNFSLINLIPWLIKRHINKRYTHLFEPQGERQEPQKKGKMRIVPQRGLNRAQRHRIEKAYAKQKK